MPSTALTFELKISFQDNLDPELKNRVISWLALQDVHSFVEGVADGLDLDPDYIHGHDDRLFDEAMASKAPILIYNFDREFISQLSTNLKAEFEDGIELEVQELETDSWQKGWQKHFHPILAGRFLVYPPWEKDHLDQLAGSNNENIVHIEIEPGMAFGTGQHESTQLCLEMLESILKERALEDMRILDVGTGSGILAIAAAKTSKGCQIYGNDVEEDALIATDANAEKNETRVQSFLVRRQGSMIPPGVPKTYHLVFANILLPVLLEMHSDLSSICLPGAYLIVAGILQEQEEELLNLYQSDFSLIRRLQKNDWACLLLQRL